MSVIFRFIAGIAMLVIVTSINISVWKFPRSSAIGAVFALCQVKPAVSVPIFHNSPSVCLRSGVPVPAPVSFAQDGNAISPPLDSEGETAIRNSPVWLDGFVKLKVISSIALGNTSLWQSIAKISDDSSLVGIVEEPSVGLSITNAWNFVSVIPSQSTWFILTFVIVSSSSVTNCPMYGSTNFHSAKKLFPTISQVFPSGSLRHDNPPLRNGDSDPVLWFSFNVSNRVVSVPALLANIFNAKSSNPPTNWLHWSISAKFAGFSPLTVPSKKCSTEKHWLPVFRNGNLVWLLPAKNNSAVIGSNPLYSTPTRIHCCPNVGWSIQSVSSSSGTFVKLNCKTVPRDSPWPSIEPLIISTVLSDLATRRQPSISPVWIWQLLFTSVWFGFRIIPVKLPSNDEPSEEITPILTLILVIDSPLSVTFWPIMPCTGSIGSLDVSKSSAPYIEL